MTLNIVVVVWAVSSCSNSGLMSEVYEHSEKQMGLIRGYDFADEISL